MDDSGTSIIADHALVIQAKSWLRFKILGWLFKDAYKFRVERTTKRRKD